MLMYTDGSEIKVGDSVLLENGKTPGTVELIIESAEELKLWRLEEPGVMLLSPPFGRIYLPASWLKEDPLRFVARSAQT